MTLLNKLQSVLNACVRFVHGIKTRSNVYSYMKESHLLPVKNRIMFKVCLMVFKVLNDISPDYLQDAVTIDVPNIGNETRILRSTLDFYKVKFPSSKDSFEYVMAKHWNSLPINLRMHSNINTFKKDLKTYYFSMAFNNA